jgi:hypothetical protein
MAARSESANRNASSLACIRSHGVFERLSSSNERSIPSSLPMAHRDAGSDIPATRSDSPALVPLSFVFTTCRLGAGRRQSSPGLFSAFPIGRAVLVSGVFDFLPRQSSHGMPGRNSHRPFTSSMIFPPEWTVLLISCALRLQLISNRCRSAFRLTLRRVGHPQKADPLRQPVRNEAWLRLKEGDLSRRMDGWPGSNASMTARNGRSEPMGALTVLIRSEPVKMAGIPPARLHPGCIPERIQSCSPGGHDGRGSRQSSSGLPEGSSDV